jgi:hypothetical protein
MHTHTRSHRRPNKHTHHRQATHTSLTVLWPVKRIILTRTSAAAGSILFLCSHMHTCLEKRCHHARKDRRINTHIHCPVTCDTQHSNPGIGRDLNKSRFLLTRVPLSRKNLQYTHKARKRNITHSHSHALAHAHTHAHTPFACEKKLGNLGINHDLSNCLILHAHARV